MCGVCCALLSALPTRDPSVSRIISLVTELLGPTASPALQQAGVIALSQCLAKQPSLRALFVSLALERRDDRMAPSMAPTLPGLSWLDMRGFIDRKTVAVLVAEHVSKTQAGNLSTSHVRLLAAATV